MRGFAAPGAAENDDFEGNTDDTDDGDAAAYGGDTAMHIATRCSDVVAVMLLLRDGADYAVLNDDGSTPLHIAASRGHLSVVHALLHCIVPKGDIGLEDDEGDTALHRAAASGRLDVVDLLLSYGADVGARNVGDFTPLHAAAEYGHVSVVGRLLEAGADPDTANDDGYTPMHLAAIGDHAGVIHQLCIYGAQLNAVGAANITPLVGAVKCRKLNAVECLLRRGAELYVCDEVGRTALFWAVVNGDVDLLQRLFDADQTGKADDLAHSFGFGCIEKTIEEERVRRSARPFVV